MDIWNLREDQDENVSYGVAKVAVKYCVGQEHRKMRAENSAAIKACKYLAKQEEKGLVHLALIPGKSGYGIDRDKVLSGYSQ